MNNNENKKKKGFKAWWAALKTPAKVAICSVASLGVASAVVFPVLSVTVWNKKSEEDTKTAVVTKEEWTAAFKYLTTESSERNFTLEGSGELHKMKGTFLIKEQGLHESYIQATAGKGTDKEYRKKENSDYYRYESNWKLIEEESDKCFTIDSSESAFTIGYVTYMRDQYDNFKILDDASSYFWQFTDAGTSYNVSLAFQNKNSLINMILSPFRHQEKLLIIILNLQIMVLQQSLIGQTNYLMIKSITY